MNRNLSIKTVSVFLLCLLRISVFAQAMDQTEAKTVQSTGVGYIVGGDVAHARDDAIEDALRKGIEQVLGTLLESETLVENYQLIDDAIITKTKGYVQKYNVLGERRLEDGLYEVTVQAVLKLSDIQSDLEGIATLMRRKNTPRVMVMIEEKNIGETPGINYVESDLNTAESSLMEAFMVKGFRFVDQSTVKRNLSQLQAAAILEGNTSQAAHFGKQLGAEVVLTGKALAKATEVVAFGAKIRSQQSTVSVKAIRTDTGDIIATATEQGKFSHIDDIAGGVKAIQKASEKLAERLMQQILDRWQADISSGAVITLNVQGVSGFEQLNKFKSGIKYYVRGLESVTQRSWEGAYAVLEVVMKGNADDLAQRISGKNMDGTIVHVTGMSQNSVTVRLSRSGQQ